MTHTYTMQKIPSNVQLESGIHLSVFFCSFFYVVYTVKCEAFNAPTHEPARLFEYILSNYTALRM